MHDCVYADAIGRIPYFIEREDGVEVCGFCHVEKTAKVAVVKTVRK